MSKKKLSFIIILLAVVIAGLAWLFIFYKKIPTLTEIYKPYATPVQLDSIPSVFNGWPIEKENLLNSFYALSSSPVDKVYTVVYQTSKKEEEAVDVYKNFFKERGINFTESDARSAYSDSSSKMLRAVSLPDKNDQVTIIFRKGKEASQILVTLIYTTYEK